MDENELYTTIKDAPYDGLACIHHWPDVSADDRYQDTMYELKNYLNDNDLSVQSGYSKTGCDMPWLKVSGMGYGDDEVCGRLHNMGYTVVPYSDTFHTMDGIYVAWNERGAKAIRRKAAVPKIIRTIGMTVLWSFALILIVGVILTLLFNISDDAFLTFYTSKTFMAFSGALVIAAAVANTMAYAFGLRDDLIEDDSIIIDRSNSGFKIVTIVFVLMLLGICLFFSKNLSSEAAIATATITKTAPKKVYVNDYNYDGDDNVLTYSEDTGHDGVKTATFLTNDGYFLKVKNINRITSTYESKPYIVYKAYEKDSDVHKKGEQKGSVTLYLPEGMHWNVKTNKVLNTRILW